MTIQGAARRVAGVVSLSALALLLSTIGAGPAAGATEGSTDNQPDALISRADQDNFTGDGIYNTTAIGQTRNVTVPDGRQVAYDIRVENDGSHLMNTVFDGCASTADFKVSYLIDTGVMWVDWTSQIAAGTLSDAIQPGVTREFRLVLKARAGAPRGATLACKFKVRSTGVDVRRDAVKVVIHRS